MFFIAMMATRHPLVCNHLWSKGTVLSTSGTSHAEKGLTSQTWILQGQHHRITDKSTGDRMEAIHERYGRHPQRLARHYLTNHDTGIATRAGAL